MEKYEPNSLVCSGSLICAASWRAKRQRSSFALPQAGTHPTGCTFGRKEIRTVDLAATAKWGFVSVPGRNQLALTMAMKLDEALVVFFGL